MKTRIFEIEFLSSLLFSIIFFASGGVVKVSNPSSHVKVNVNVNLEVGNFRSSGCCIDHPTTNPDLQCKTANKTEDERVNQWLWTEFYPQYSPLVTKCQYISFAWSTDISNENKRRENDCWSQVGNFISGMIEDLSKFDLKSIKTEFIARQINRIIDGEMSAKAKSESDTDMEQVYSTAKICPFEHQDCNVSTDNTWTLNVEINRILHESRNSSLREYIWNEFHRAVGRNMATVYEDYVDRTLEYVKGSKYSDYGAKWRDQYDADGGNVQESAETIWKEILPLYEELYTHVRRRLSHIYPTLVRPNEPIPAHLFDNIWGQSWSGLYSILRPYNLSDESESHRNPIDVAMQKQNYTALKMIRTAEKFYESIGFPSLPQSFYDLSMIQKPKDKNRKVVCHASAWDMLNGLDFMVKQCTNIDQDDLNMVHHEMGHIYYYIAYKDLPVLLRRGANPAFHEAVGDTMILSTNVPKYLKQIGLLAEIEHNHEKDLNHLMKEALEFVAFFPFGYLVDLWRWDTFAKKVPVEKWNHHWWYMKYKYQGMTRPTPEERDVFDPVGKYHVASKTPYIRYFFARILIFQYHKQLCLEAGHQGPLHECTIYGSKKAGNRLWKMLQLGHSKPWPEILKVMLGDQPISAEPLKEFFKPLMEWLKVENSKYEDNCYGWGQSWPKDSKLAQPRCPEKPFPE